MALIPRPNGPDIRLAGIFRLPGSLAADTGGFAPWCLTAFRDRTGLPEGGGDPWLVLRRDPGLPAEAFRLTVRPEGVAVEAVVHRILQVPLIRQIHQALPQAGQEWCVREMITR